MKEIKRVAEKKVNKKWVETFTCTDELEVYKALTSDLIAKKINACQYIKTIKRTPNYDGTQTITVTYDNDCRSIYTVKN